MMFSQFYDENMSKRIQVMLPDRAAADLDNWAALEGRSISNLAAYLLEKAIDEARQQGLIKNESDSSSSSERG